MSFAEPLTAAAVGPQAAVVHLARRLTFGPTPALLTEIAAGPDAWLRAQLDPESIDDTETDRRLFALETLGFDLGRLLPSAMPVLDATGLTPAIDGASQVLATASESLEELEASLTRYDRERIERAVAELRLATVIRATYSRRQLFEQLVDFWWNRFNVWPGKGPFVGAAVVAADRDTIRPHALGRFADLLPAVASSPAMLVFLDNWRNQAGALNENYGRELLELHTVGVAAGFTEQDVREAARVFTGWTIDFGSGTFRFEPDWHDAGPKRVLDWTTAGIEGTAGVTEGTALLDHLARHPATAHHLATELVRRFVADDPPADLVASTAATYLAADTALAPVLEHIVTSDPFAASAGTKFRRPLDFFVASLRGVGAEVGEPIGFQTAAAQTLDAVLAELGQRPLDASSPAGYPERADGWLGAGLLSRWMVAHELGRGALAGIHIDHDDLAGDAATAGELADRVLRRLHGTAAPDRREAVLAGLGADEHTAVHLVEVSEVVALSLCAAEVHRR